MSLCHCLTNSKRLFFLLSLQGVLKALEDAENKLEGVIQVCVRVCVGVRVCACMCMYVCWGGGRAVWVWVRVYVCVCVPG